MRTRFRLDRVARRWFCVAVSDRRTLGGVTQFATQFGFRADPLARKQLIPKTRRDVRVVEGARLESDALEPRRDVPTHLFSRPFTDLTPRGCLSVFPRK